MLTNILYVLFLMAVIGFILWLGFARLMKRSVEYQNRAFRSGMHEVDQMDGRTFETKLGLHFAQRGFEVETTPTSGDYGADLVLTDANGNRTVVQAKRYSGAVGVKAVQEVSAARAMYGATGAIVITNSHFTKNAMILAANTGVYLWDRERLIDEFSLNTGSANTL
ncbi:restriction endonuclease [Alicyclobacillus sp. ALC3]|uniref:restriction endonuclease n=1 Tax=Alicyclobacillus sp. ALC3 TaxID=2796143 RepID=UPI002378179F|nr:restriction endonuclease [Alicyclobacillus sp. ALC3]WDL97946.1 restriction endonuclease [Alicyclobacillus sp. ALC3]